METSGTMQSAESDGGAWTPEVEHLLEDWHKRAYAAQSAHYASADRFRLLNYVVGIPTIAVSSVVGTPSPTTDWSGASDSPVTGGQRRLVAQQPRHQPCAAGWPTGAGLLGVRTVHRLQ